MKELKEEAKRHHEAKLHKYGASHEERKACGGSMKRAHGGHVHKVDLECKGETGPEVKRAHGGKVHPNREKDLNLIEELEHDHMKKHGGKVHHRDMGGPVAGGPSPRLGRGRKGGKKGTNVNVVIAGKGDGPGAAPPMMPPPALGAGPSAMPPKPPMMPPPSAAGPAGLPPRPGVGVKHGGKVHHDGHHKHHKHERHHGHAEHHAKKEHKHQAR